MPENTRTESRATIFGLKTLPLVISKINAKVTCLPLAATRLGRAILHGPST